MHAGAASSACVPNAQVLSDDLVRVDSYVESVLRKIERQYADSEASITEQKADQGEHKAGLSVHNSA